MSDRLYSIMTALEVKGWAFGSLISDRELRIIEDAWKAEGIRGKIVRVSNARIEMQ